MGLPHETRAVRVWADVDLGVADMVEYLNTIPGVRTMASCQGTIGEGGPHPYRAQVMATWPRAAEPRLRHEFDATVLGEGWGYLHRREGSKGVWIVEGALDFSGLMNRDGSGEDR